MQFTIYTSDAFQNARNCVYPYPVLVTDEPSFRRAVSHDYVAAEYKDGRRANSNFIRSDVLVMDSDGDGNDPEMWLTPQKIRDRLPGVQFAVAYSRNHMKPKGTEGPKPRFHAFFPTKEPIADPEQYRRMKEKLLELLPGFDAAAKDAGRFFFAAHECDVELYEGEYYIDEMEIFEPEADLLSGAGEGPPAPAGGPEKPAEAPQIPAQPLNLDSETVAAVMSALDSISPESYDTWFRVGAALAHSGFDVSLWDQWSQKDTRPGKYSPADFTPEKWAELQKKPDNGNFLTYKTIFKLAWANGWTPPGMGILDFVESMGDDLPEIENLDVFPRSDTMEGRLFAGMFYARIRSCAEICKDGWMMYDGVKWSPDKEGVRQLFHELALKQVEQAEGRRRKAQKTLDDLAQALQAQGIRDITKTDGNPEVEEALKESEQAEQFYRFAVKELQSRNIGNALTEARPYLAVHASAWDSDPGLLNTPKYVVRLETSETRERQYNDYFTKVTAVSPNRENAEMWDTFLKQITCGDADLQRYLQLVVGMALYGQVRTEGLIVATGEGSNGKSTFWNAVKRVLGDYGSTTTPDLLMKDSRLNVLDEMAALRGKRLVLAPETEDGKLDPAMLKRLTSRDTMRARQIYTEGFELEPSHTLVLCTNSLPAVAALDGGTWRRLHVIPFSATFTGAAAVPDLENKLVSEAGGAILAWGLHGARMYAEAGFRIEEPEAVRKAGYAYKEEQSYIERFVTERLEHAPDCEMTSTSLYNLYKGWADDAGEKQKSQIRFSKDLVTAGYKKGKDGRNNSVFIGLAIKSY